MDTAELLRARIARFNQVGQAEAERYAFSCSVVDGAIQVQVKGHPRMVHSQGLLGALLGVREALPPSASPVTVDLGACTGLDSATGGLLLLLGKELQDRGGRLLLRRPSERIRRILSTLGLDRVAAIAFTQ